jgi:hypothetical protein
VFNQERENNFTAEEDEENVAQIRKIASLQQVEQDLTIFLLSMFKAYEEFVLRRTSN